MPDGLGASGRAKSRDQEEFNVAEGYSAMKFRYWVDEN